MWLVVGGGGEEDTSSSLSSGPPRQTSSSEVEFTFVNHEQGNGEWQQHDYGCVSHCDSTSRVTVSITGLHNMTFISFTTTIQLPPIKPYSEHHPSSPPEPTHESQQQHDP